MRDEWRHATVADVAVAGGLVGGPFGSDLGTKDYVRHGIPVIRGCNLKSSKYLDLSDLVFVSEDKAHALRRNEARPGDVILTQRGTLGQVAVVPDEPFDRYIVSQSQMRLRVDRSIALPHWVYWAFRSKRMVAEIKGRTTATANPHINLGICSRLPLLVPPLATQRRMVDLLDCAVEATLAVERLRTRAGQVLASVLRDHAAHVEGRSHRIADLASSIGGVWGKPAGEQELDVLALGPRIFSSGLPEVDPRDSPMRSVSAAQFASRSLVEGDIVLERSGGTEDQPVGRVAYVPQGLPPCVPTDFMRLLRAHRELVEPRYLFWRLWTDYLNGEPARYQRRTTGIFNLPVKDYLAREVVIPSRSHQARLVEVADAGADLMARQLDLLRLRHQLVASLAESLLTGAHEVPASYDKLLDQAS